MIISESMLPCFHCPVINNPILISSSVYPILSRSLHTERYVHSAMTFRGTTHSAFLLFLRIHLKPTKVLPNPADADTILLECFPISSSKRFCSTKRSESYTELPNSSLSSFTLSIHFFDEFIILSLISSSKKLLSSLHIKSILL